MKVNHNILFFWTNIPLGPVFLENFLLEIVLLGIQKLDLIAVL